MHRLSSWAIEGSCSHLPGRHRLVALDTDFTPCVSGPATTARHDHEIFWNIRRPHGPHQRRPTLATTAAHPQLWAMPSHSCGKRLTQL